MPTQAEREALGDWITLLEPDQNIDRRTCSRQVPMEVLSFGAPRTGTLTMATAYKILDIPSYHFGSIVTNSRDADMWLEALDAKYDPNSTRPGFTRRDFDQLLGHVGATTDVPSILLWQELLAAYPEAKVVLVERDGDKWFKSFNVLMTNTFNPVGRYVLRYTDPGRTGRILNVGFAWIEGWFDVRGDLSKDAVMSKAHATYRKHYADIRATVPKEQLLEYQLGSGWKPLCDFLGKDVPSEPFPHRNDAATLEVAFKYLILGGLKQSAINLTVVAGLGFLVWRAASLIS